MSTPQALMRRRGTLSFEPSGMTEPPNDVHDRTISSLNTAVQLIGVVNNFLTPIPLAKGVLGSVAGILDIIKTTYANKGDFQDVAKQCQMIGLTIWNATTGTPERRVDDRMQQALFTLQSSVENIRTAIEKKSKSNIVSKVFHSTLNKETIAKWKTDLDRCLTAFNTDLNISAHAKLDELLASFQRSGATLAPNLQPLNDGVPNELPPRPLAFFGRDAIVQDTVKHLTEGSKVALIGPGGIGKSSIARAVLNDEALVAKFGQQRFFVRFDDMDVAQVTLTTFLNRIARVLGYNASVNTYNVISRALSRSDTLLVLDNAETFLDAPVDGGRIADAIDELGARPQVVILLTTRTTVLPPNLNWIRTRVPSLAEDDACKAFKMFYSSPIETSTLVKLLVAIDFHPLSINLLAQAAVQNEWSTEELIIQWNKQRASLLEVGGGKIQSLGVTIETSLNSPSIRKFGDIIRQFLQIIAFLPQGVNTKWMIIMVKSQGLRLESYRDALYKQSLAYLDGDFITVLAPIRLYMTEKKPISENPLFQEVLSHYTNYLSVCFLRYHEDLNMERVFTYCLSRRMTTIHVLESLTEFVDYLRGGKPRPVPALRQAVSTLDPDDLVPSTRAWIAAFKAFPYTRRKMALIAKAKCLFSLSLLMRWIGRLSEAEELLAEAHTLLLGVKQKIFTISFDPGSVYEELIVTFDGGFASMLHWMGNYRAAEEAVRSCMQRAASMRKLKNTLYEAGSSIQLWGIQMKRGKSGLAEEILKLLPLCQKMLPSLQYRVWLLAGATELHDGQLDRAQEYFQRARELMYIDDHWGEFKRLELFVGLAEVAYLQRNKTEWRSLRAQTLSIISEARQMEKFYRIFMGDIYRETEFFSISAGYLAMDGKIEEARELLAPYLSANSKQSHWATIPSLYTAGCIELHAGNLATATEYFQQAKEVCVAIQEFRFRTLAERALGEIALQLQDIVAAKAHFDATSELCEIAGVPKNRLDYELSCFKPSEVYDGWERYQQDSTMSGR